LHTRTLVAGYDSEAREIPCESGDPGIYLRAIGDAFIDAIVEAIIDADQVFAAACACLRFR
jgi:hypothetical protein